MFKKIDPKTTFPQMEKEVLKFWKENKIFEKSLANREGAERYSFFDGPPFATGTPHYGHIVASTMKDVVPRYWTMRGYYVERKWGWDCHGLPIENIVEKELGSKAKKDIEKMGVARFNELCRSKVLEYVEDWKAVISRLGRWADMENAYKTMDRDYMESVWWVFRELYEKGLIYEGYRAMHICPRCETTLSQSEVSEGYKDVKDLSAIAKFELISTNCESGTKARTADGGANGKTYVLAWTTTPWTLIGNAALAVGKDIDYVWAQTVLLKEGQEPQDETYVLAKDRVEQVMAGKEYVVVRETKGSELVGLSYRPLFDFYFQKEGIRGRENGWKIYAGEFVTTEEGTGVVHIAPAFGEDDLLLGQKEELPLIQHVGMDGIIKPEAGEFAGMHVKPSGDHMATDVEIIKYLSRKNLLFAKEKHEHSYPHCWRCDTPLLNYATSSWFVAVSKIKERALELAERINWSPAHIKEGRFGKWLEGARDWSVSRQRFWASVIPIWQCECGERKVFGSVKELEEASGQKVDDLHKHIVDEITFPCPKCQKTMRRVPDVLDTWFDSGSMPYAQLHYPFEHAEEFVQSFPAHFIAEGVDQTRAWFYYLHLIATGIKDSPAFQNVIVNGIVLAQDGKKMSKRLQNYPDPLEVVEKYGADALRYYLMASPVVSAQNLNFSEKDLAENVRGMLRMLWNTYSFFVLYASIDGWRPSKGEEEKSGNILDRWILSELAALVRDYNGAMENYELNRAARLLPKFVDSLSNWYVRRSRKRFWKSQSDEDKENAYATLYKVLLTLSKVLAPLTPFMAEEIYRNLTGGGECGKESVHLEDFPQDITDLDQILSDAMGQAREVISQGLLERASAKIKVRQPLAKATVREKMGEELMDIVRDELNVKEVLVDGSQEKAIVLDTALTPELIAEGKARELIRHIQEMRKEAGYEVDNRIQICYNGMSEVWSLFGELIAKETLCEGLKEGEMENPDLEKDFSLDGEDVTIGIKRL